MCPKEAYAIIKKLHAQEKCIECIDFGSFYGFVFLPFGEEEGELFGGAVDTVDKKTGRVSTFNPIANLALLDTAKTVEPREYLFDETQGHIEKA